MHITLITSATVILSEIASAYADFEQQYPNLCTIDLFEPKGPILHESKRIKLQAALAKSDFVIVDLRLCPEEWSDQIAEILQAAPPTAEIVQFGLQNRMLGGNFKLGQFSATDLYSLFDAHRKPPTLFGLNNEDTIQQLADWLPEDKRADFRNLGLIIEYWVYANEDYLFQFLLLLIREYGQVQHIELPEPYRPIITDDIVIYDNKAKSVFDSLASFQANASFDESKSTIGVIFLGYHFKASHTKCVFELIERLSAVANVVPILASSIGGINVARFRNLVQSETLKVSLLINCVPFRLGSGPMGGNSHEVVPMLEELGVPIMHPFFITKQTESAWQQSIQGIDSSEYLTSVMLPELDGSIDTYPIGALADFEEESLFDFDNPKLKLIEERAELLVKRVEHLLSLQRKANHDKKVAIIGYNYPPGEDSIFSASYIDTFESITNMIRMLHHDGYNVPLISKDELMDHFTAGKLLNSGKWGSEDTYNGFIRYSADEYRQSIRQHTLSTVTEDWGASPGTIMAEDAQFLIPGLVAGNIFIGLQPARSDNDQLTNAYHDKSLSPHHQYVAFYSWIQDKFQADALVHVGTHGTLEFLKGKEVAMSGDCFPDLLVGHLPHLYLYYIGNPSEAMIAKRRTHATLVSYQTPPYIVSDLYGDYVQLEDLIANYSEAEKLDPNRAEQLLQEVLRKAGELHFPSADIHEIEIELYRIKRSLIPKGLHIFGNGYDEAAAKDFMKHVLRYDRGTMKSLKRLLAEDQGLDYDQLLETPVRDVLEQLEASENVLVDQYLVDGQVASHIFRNNDLLGPCHDTLAYGLLALRNSMDTQEEAGLLAGLSGKYLPARLSADIVKSPDILPSGTNLYQFDPRLIPEKTAAERGKLIAENTIATYYNQFGTYPKCTGIVLWGFETSRTQGETIGQILQYLGVRVIMGRGAFRPQYEIIPLEELGRPRIDVVINISGYFRDIFPNVLDDLNLLFARIAKLDESEDDNSLKANTNRIYQSLIEDGYSSQEAFDLAVARIFGPTEGEYSTRVTNQVGSQSWVEESELAEGYMKDIQFVYGLSHRGKANEKLLKLQMQAVDLVSQIRSNLELEVIDLDHYYEYFGGFSKSVELLRGFQTPVYISDTTGEKVLTEDVQVSIERGVRTRLLNPKWIDGLLEHQRHGAQQVLERFENLIGLAATTNKVESWVFSELNTTYVADEERRKQFSENNRWAYHSMMERLLESNSRGYWDATDEELQQLQEAYLQLEGTIEEKV